MEDEGREPGPKLGVKAGGRPKSLGAIREGGACAAVLGGTGRIMHSMRSPSTMSNSLSFMLPSPPSAAVAFRLGGEEARGGDREVGEAALGAALGGTSARRYASASVSTPGTRLLPSPPPPPPLDMDAADDLPARSRMEMRVTLRPSSREAKRLVCEL